MAASAAPDGLAPELIDIYDDFNQNNGEEGDFMGSVDPNDLYDDVVTGSVDQRRMSGGDVRTHSKDLEKHDNPKPLITYSYSGGQIKRLSVYVGNFSWWTSDTDLLNLASTMGVKDILEIKFAENRANGQSRGYAELVVSTEASLQKLLETMPQCHINGERVDCRFATRQNLAVFETLANKRIPQRSNSKSESESATDNRPNFPSSSEPCPPSHAPLVMPPHPHVNKLPSIAMPFYGRPPPLYPPPHPPPLLLPPPIPPPLYPPPPPHMPTHQPPPALHLNPAFFPPPQESYSNNPPPYSRQSREREDSTPPLPDSEYDELMNRNKTIASSAISKAVAGAAAGDVSLAVETLLTAIAVIKQSRVYSDERCRALVTSLKDCLFSIESKSYGSRKKHRSRERERSRDREHRDRDRERERERDRDRDREGSYSQNWEAGGMSRRYRDRSLSAERDRERMRVPRDRHREHRDRHR